MKTLDELDKQDLFKLLVQQAWLQAGLKRLKNAYHFKISLWGKIEQTTKW